MARRWLPLAAALPLVSGASNGNAQESTQDVRPDADTDIEEGMVLQSLADVDKEAVCGDGTPAGYYWEEGAKGNHLWVVYLDGGHWCYSGQSCLSRCSRPGDHKCSSREWPAAKQRGTAARCEAGQACGIFAPAQSADLEGANKVFVPYCSSDAWLGDALAFGLNMRGSRVVRAVLQDLVFSRGLGHGEQRHTLLFGGGSAGARGAMAHLDYVGSMLKAASRNVDIVGFLDSALWVDLEFRSAGADSLANQTWAIYQAANIVHLGSRCLDHFGKAEGWKCIFGEYRLPFVKTPFVLVQSQSDLFQLMWNMQRKPSSPEQLSFAEAFATRVRGVVDKLRSPLHHVLSWSCWSHDLGLTGRFSTDSVGEVTMEVALQRFLGLDNVDSSNESYIDRCQGFACGTGCAGVHRPKGPGAKGENSTGKPKGLGAKGENSTGEPGKPLPKSQEDLQASSSTMPPSESQQDQQASSSTMPLSEFRQRVQTVLADQGLSSVGRGASAAGFSMLDRDQSGTLDRQEVEGVADWAGSGISARQAGYAFHVMDRNADGRLSPDEFGLVEDGVGPPISVVDLKSRIADSYSSPGEAIKAMGPEPISRSGFTQVAEAFQRPLTAEQAKYAFDGLDVNRDGSLSTYEIMSVLDSGQFYLDGRSLRKGAGAVPGAIAARERETPPIIMAVCGAALGLLLLPLSYVVLTKGFKGPAPDERPPPDLLRRLAAEGLEQTTGELSPVSPPSSREPGPGRTWQSLPQEGPPQEGLPQERQSLPHDGRVRWPG